MVRSRAATIGTLLAAVVIAVALAVASRGTRIPMTPEVAREMRAGGEFAAQLERSLEATPAESISVADAVAGGYLERLRLGLGSPFRLIDYALADPLLSDSLRRLVGYAVLHRTLDGDTYHTPPSALTVAASLPARLPLDIAARHVALIDSVVAAASDPRGGELTIREAYRIAMAAGSVGRRGPWLGTQTAALARDRMLARNDVVQLLATARRNRMDPLGLIPVWRLERRFAVERPVMDALRPDVERNALADVGRVVRELDSLAGLERRATQDSVHDELVRVARLGGEGARRLTGVATVRAQPPQAPVTVAVTSTVRLTRAVDSPAAAETQLMRSALARFTQRAVNEEALAAEYALFQSRDTAGVAQPSLAVLWAAVSMRAYGQERVWFPGH